MSYRSSFFQRLFESPLRQPLGILLIGILGILLANLFGLNGVLCISLEKVIQICTALCSLFVALILFTHSYWKRDQAREKIAWAKAQGRMICECTEIGSVRVMIPQNNYKAKVFECPTCKDRIIERGGSFK